ncbi:MAG: hypothetical protein U9O64_05420 [Campylobacterota bacterium]|nr:hypothetical protein [Campylobacterota bacterium]
MNTYVRSFCDGYAKSLSLFPSNEENSYTDWENIGKDIDVSIKKYQLKMDDAAWQELKKKKMLKRLK